MVMIGGKSNRSLLHTKFRPKPIPTKKERSASFLFVFTNKIVGNRSRMGQKGHPQITKDMDNKFSNNIPKCKDGFKVKVKEFANFYMNTNLRNVVSMVAQRFSSSL